MPSPDPPSQKREDSPALPTARAEVLLYEAHPRSSRLCCRSGSGTAGFQAKAAISNLRSEAKLEVRDFAEAERRPETFAAAEAGIAEIDRY